MEEDIGQVNFSEDLGEDLMKYIKVYVDEVDTILERTCERREVIDILLQEDIDIDGMEDADEEIKQLAKDPKKRAEVCKRLEGELAEDVKQYKIIDSLLRELFDEVGKRIKV